MIRYLRILKSATKKGGPKAPLANKHCSSTKTNRTNSSSQQLLALNRSNNNVTLGVDTLRVSSHIHGIPQSQVDETTLVSIHGSKTHRAPALNCLLSIGTSQPLNLIPAATLVALNINNDGIVEANALVKQRGKHNLQGIERHTMAANENGKIPTTHIENELALISIVLINRTGVLAKAGEKGAQNINGNIGNDVELSVIKLARLLKRSTDSLKFDALYL